MTERAMTATVRQFCELSGMGKTKVFQLINNGTLASIKIGQTRLIILDSYRRIIEEQTASVRDKSQNSMGTEMGAGRPR